MVGGACAQSNLSACQGSDTTAWSNCTGTKTFTNGDKYVGEFKDEKFNGQGTYTFASGEKYVGEFKDGKYDGRGTYYASNGSIVNEGMWADNKFLYFISLQQSTKPDMEKEILHESSKVAKKENIKHEEKTSLKKHNAQPRTNAGWRQMWGL